MFWHTLQIETLETHGLVAAPGMPSCGHFCTTGTAAAAPPADTR